jgi:hypothetical protein
VASRPATQYETHENIARIARGFHHRAEIPANHHIPTRSMSGRYSRERSIIVDPRSTNPTVYRSRESPAKRYNTGGAVDAVGTLQRLSSTFSALS